MTVIIETILINSWWSNDTFWTTQRIFLFTTTLAWDVKTLSYCNKYIYYTKSPTRDICVSRARLNCIIINKNVIVVLFFFLSESDLPVLKDYCSKTDWYLLGHKLGINSDQLDEIERDVPPDARLKVMFRYWIANGETSWAKLVHALMSPSIQKEALARKIAAEHRIK